MQPSNLQGNSDRLDTRIEELCWENEQVFPAHPSENSDRNTWAASPLSYSFSDIALRSTEKEHLLKLVDIEDEKIDEATAFASGDDLTDLLDNLDSISSVGMTRNTSPSLSKSQSYALSTEMKRGDPLQQHMPSLSGGLEDLARLCGPVLQSGNLSVGARGRSLVPPLLLNIPPDDLSKLSDAVLNRISARCMGSSSMHSLENTLTNQSAGDTVVLNTPCINPTENLLSSSNATSIDINPSLVLPDPGGSRLSSGNDGKTGEAAGGKKARAVDDIDSDSEGSFDEMVALRKPRPEQGPSSKRIRAAEIHNEAERKRRGRINEKLKALQDLIPNANKADKASVLTEAIDYLKKLRLQLQMMCCRNGLVVSPFPVSQEQNREMHKEGGGSSLNREIGVAPEASVGPLGVQRFPLTTSMAVQRCGVTKDVPSFNEASLAATTTRVSTSKGIGHECNTSSSQQIPCPHPFQGIT